MHFNMHREQATTTLLCVITSAVVHHMHSKLKYIYISMFTFKILNLCLAYVTHGHTL